MTIKTQALAVPFLLPSTPCLGKGVFLGILTATVEAFGKFLVRLPSSSPFLYTHDFVSMPNRWIDFHGFPLHDFLPFSRVHFYHWLRIHRGFNLGPQIRYNVFQAHFVSVASGVLVVQNCCCFSPFFVTWMYSARSQSLVHEVRSIHIQTDSYAFAITPS